MRVFLALLAAKGWFLSQLDINNAFLNGNLQETAYMDLPQGYFVEGDYPLGSILVCNLHKLLYGLR